MFIPNYNILKNIKMVKRLIISIFTLIVVITGCSSKTNYSRKPVTNIQITPSNKIVTLGNDFSISFHTKLKDGKIKQIDLFVDNQLIKTTIELDFSIKLNSKYFLPGNHSIKIVALKTDGISSINYTSISILSDIVPQNLNYKILNTYSHNTAYFTEGFEFYKGTLFEGTGDYGTSYVVSYNPKNSKIISSLKIDNQYFGEGITILNGKLYQLTYKTRIGFVYNVNTFEKEDEFTFTSNEGWGLTNDGKNLIMSDGTSKINFIDASNFKIIKSIEVCDNNEILNNINELEYVKGIIYANILGRNSIIKIDALTGKVLAYINMEGLMALINSSAVDVLNGIAYNQNENTFYITGKLWPKMFSVRFE
jgi:glutaminyl-peptide cyclotransferase